MLRRVQGDDGHVNVAAFLGTIITTQGRGLLFELYDHRDFWRLLSRRGALLTPEVRYYGRQLMEGLTYIHSQGLIHCDFKPNNILVASGMVLKISDYGLAEDIAEQAEVPR